jgi:hypothetical protein
MGKARSKAARQCGGGRFAGVDAGLLIGVCGMTGYWDSHHYTRAGRFVAVRELLRGVGNVLTARLEEFEDRSASVGSGGSVADGNDGPRFLTRNHRPTSPLLREDSSKREVLTSLESDQDVEAAVAAKDIRLEP